MIMYKVDFTSQNEEEEERQYQAIIGKRPSPISSELELELRKYEDAHKMASESNLTLHNAIKVGWRWAVSPIWIIFAML